MVAFQGTIRKHTLWHQRLTPSTSETITRRSTIAIITKGSLDPSSLDHSLPQGPVNKGLRHSRTSGNGNVRTSAASGGRGLRGAGGDPFWRAERLSNTVLEVLFGRPTAIRPIFLNCTPIASMIDLRLYGSSPPTFFWLHEPVIAEKETPPGLEQFTKDLFLSRTQKPSGAIAPHSAGPGLSTVPIG